MQTEYIYYRKKAIRVISRITYNAHTAPLFKELNLIRLNDIIFINELKFYHKLKHNCLPLYMQTFENYAYEFHNYNTRNRLKLSFPSIHHEFARRCIRYSMVKSINDCPDCIKEKITTHSLKGLSTYAKKSI